MSGGCGNEPIMHLRNIIYLGSSFKNLKVQRFKLIILAFKKIFGLKQADIDPVFFKQL